MKTNEQKASGPLAFCYLCSCCSYFTSLVCFDSECRQLLIVKILVHIETQLLKIVAYFEKSFSWPIMLYSHEM